MSTLWVKTAKGYVRADAVTGVEVVRDWRRSGWRLVATVAGGGAEGTWDQERGGDVGPALTELARGSGDPEVAAVLPGAVVRALARHRDAAGAVVIKFGDEEARTVSVELEDWSREAGWEQ